MPRRPTRASALGLAALLTAATPLIAQDYREADHQELRRMLTTVRDAINTQQIDKLEPLVADRFSIILADAQLVTDLKQLKAYYQRLTGGRAPALRTACVGVCD
jgi:hypothetical protein